MIEALRQGSPPVNFATADLNCVFDGNSIVANIGASTATKGVVSQLGLIPPINGRTVIANIGVSGQTIGQSPATTASMRGRRAAFLDPLWAPGKTNILFVLEGTNTVCNNPGRTGLQAAADLAGYCAEVLAVHPWKIVMLLTIPRFNMTPGIYQSDLPAGNAELLAFNKYVMANYRSMGIKLCIDPMLQADGIFTAPAAATNTPGNMSPFMADKIHPNDAGHLKFAQYIAAVLRRLPNR